MKKLFIVFAVSAAALFGGPAANAMDNAAKVKTSPGVVEHSTDISSRGRHYGVQRYGYRHYHPRYGNSYGYYQPRGYYGGGYGSGYSQPYGRGYGYGGPSISFGFGGGRGWY